MSAALEENGGRRGLTPRAVYGHLLTWDFHGRADVPASRARCGLHATVAILNDPPIL